MVKQVLIAVDQLINTFIDNGYADETLSARAYRMTDISKGWHRAHVVIDWLFKTFFVEVNHCYLSCLSEWQRMQLPKTYHQCRSYAAFF